MVTCLAFSPNGRFLASGSWDRTARLWRLGPPGKGRAPRTARPTATLRGHASPLDHLAFSPDGQTLATTSWDKTVRLWDVTTGRELATLEGHASGTAEVAFSPDGRTLASSSWDGVVKLWNLATHQEVITLRGHETSAILAFSPDGNVLTTSSPDAPLRQWRAAPLAETGKGGS
jgi:WD40 repeat protein